MRQRTLLLAAGGVVALGAGSVAFILLLDSGPSAWLAGSPDAAPQAASPALPPLSPLTPPDGGLVGGATPVPPAQPAAPPPLPPPQAGSWESLPIMARPGSLGAAITADLQPVVSECFDEYVQARFGPQGGRHTTVDYGAMEDTGEPVVLLNIETFRDGARIVDAPVETRGRASDGLLACAQAALRGKQVSVPGTPPGQRFRVRYPIVP
jgi:hypothetical protein